MANQVKSHYSGFYLPDGADPIVSIEVMMEGKLVKVEVGIDKGHGDKRAKIEIDGTKIYRAVREADYYRRFFVELEGAWYGFTTDLLEDDDLMLEEGVSLRSYSSLDPDAEKTRYPTAAEEETEETQKMSLAEIQQEFAELAERKTDLY